MSQHFQSSVGGEPLPEFDTSLRSRAASVEGDDDDDDEEDKIEDNDGEYGNTQDKKMSRQFWSHVEEEVLGNTFWGRVTDTFDQVRRYRNRCWEERVQGFREPDSLKEREMEPLRSRWKRINASVSKFVGAYAHAESRRTSGQSDDDVMKTAFAIYKSDSKKHAEFQDKHCWEILRGADQWKPIGSTVKMQEEDGNSRRWL
ncbi:glutathione S-transferase T3-like [Beta vulgaris subsp. vulgaris]|uniref:glutathione S-transferase T3-like n=1 Tax=Beta vulgaris subsp. vulgaris TaxID=3555 RepID=UPI0020374FEF|nr:glutathione S-transferase T3-like [Beta vulgaris subsp. vulgaris]